MTKAQPLSKVCFINMTFSLVWRYLENYPICFSYLTMLRYPMQTRADSMKLHRVYDVKTSCQSEEKGYIFGCNITKYVFLFDPFFMYEEKMVM